MTDQQQHDHESTGKPNEKSQVELLQLELEREKHNLDKYRFKNDCWRFHVGYGMRWQFLYFAVVGTLLTLIAREDITVLSHRLLATAGFVGCSWMILVIRIHLIAVTGLRDEMFTLSERAGFDDRKSDEGAKYVSYMKCVFVGNLAILALFIVLLFIGPMHRDAGDTQPPAVSSIHAVPGIGL